LMELIFPVSALPLYSVILTIIRSIVLIFLTNKFCLNLAILIFVNFAVLSVLISLFQNSTSIIKLFTIIYYSQ